MSRNSREVSRVVSDPKPRATVAVTKSRTLPRYSVGQLDQFDASIRRLIREAYDEARAAAGSCRVR